jgi:hypothetical protein
MRDWTYDYTYCSKEKQYSKKDWHCATKHLKYNYQHSWCRVGRLLQDYEVAGESSNFGQNCYPSSLKLRTNFWTVKFPNNIKFLFIISNQCCGLGSGSGSALIWLSWIQIRIRIGNADPVLDPGAWKLTKIYKYTWFPAFQIAFVPSFIYVLVSFGQFVILRYDKISFVRGNAGNSKRENPAKLQCKKCAKSVRARNPPNNQASVEKQ